MKKLILCLCVAFLLSSASIAATAKEYILYSNNFDGYPKDRALAVAYNKQLGWNTDPTLTKYVKWQTPTKYKLVSNAGGLTNEKLEALPGLSIVCGNSRDDDTSAVYIREKSGIADDFYMSVPKGRFGSQGNTCLDGFDIFKAKDGESLVIAFKMMMTQNGTNRSDKSLSVSFGGECTYAYSEDIEGIWQEVLIQINPNGVGTLKIQDEIIPQFSAQDFKSLTVMLPESGNKAENGKYPLVNIDDIVIMSATEPFSIPKAETVTDKATFNKTTIAYDESTHKIKIDTVSDEPFDCCIIASRYRLDGTLETIVSTQTLSDISSENTPLEVTCNDLWVGDKLMLWSSIGNMIPLAEATVVSISD